MADKTAKKKTKKPAKPSSDPSVLGNLRPTRASRIGGDRRTPAAATAAKPSATKKATPAKPKATAKPKAAAAKKPTAAKQRKRAAAPKATRPTTPPPPRPEPPRDGGRPSTTEVVTTAVQAAGELAQIGLTVGRQVLKRATDRLPRP